MNVIQVARSEYNYLDSVKFKLMVSVLSPSYIINTYGYTGKPNVDSCELNANECYGRNVTHQQKIHEYASDCGIPLITISSGCIYNDESYDKVYDEEDAHTFGETNPSASVYSKCKSEFDSLFANSEYVNSNYLLRIRMPFCDIGDDKDYIGKVLKYDKLVNYKNSLTYIPDLVFFIEEIISQRNIPTGIYNIVNTHGISCSEIYHIAEKYTNRGVPDKWYTGDELLSMGLMKCRRSNCVLDNYKASQYMQFTDVKIAIKHTLEDKFGYEGK
jgi:UDP-glucose 4,6-dehydratase